MQQDLEKYLKKLKTPYVKTPKHREKLKNALLNSVYFQQKQKNIFTRSNLFHYVRTMSFPKKIIPVGILAIMSLYFAGQSYVSWSNTAYAKELIHEAIKQVENAEPETEEQKKALKLIRILEQANANEELNYVGNEEASNGSFYQKFTLKDPDFSSDAVILIEDPGKKNPEAAYHFQQSAVMFRMERTFAKLQAERIELELDENGNILNFSETQAKLKDPNLKKEWLKELIRFQNDEFFQFRTAMEKKMFDENLKEKLAPEIIASMQKAFEINQKFLPNLEKLLQDSEVVVAGFQPVYEEETGKFKAELRVFKITGQQQRNTEAKTDIQKAIDKISKFESKEAQNKKHILKLAFESKTLTKYTENFFGFVYPGLQEELNVLIDPQNQTENFVTFTFRSEALSVTPEKGEWIDVKVKDGKITNLEELRTKFEDKNLKDDLLRYIIKSQNKALLEGIKKYELPGSLGYKNLPEKVKKSYPVLTPEIFEQLEDLLLNAEVPVIDRIVNDENKKDVLYTLGIYPLGTAQKKEISKTIEETIKNLKHTAFAEKEAKIQLLKEAEKAQDLKYAGEEILPNGSKKQKISFTQNGQTIEILFSRVGSFSTAVSVVKDDQNNVYLYDFKIPGADGKSFEILNQNYSKDQNHVYIVGQKIPGLDPKTTQLFKGGGEYIKDAKSVYFHDIKVEDADVETFEELYASFAKDKNHVYFSGKKLDQADAATFTLHLEVQENREVGMFFGKDKNHVYTLGGDILKEADSKTFTAFSRTFFAKDQKNVYSFYNYLPKKEKGNWKIEGADPETFTPLGKDFSTPFAKDKNHVYLDQLPLKEIDPESAKILGENFSLLIKDKKALYQLLKGEIKKIDVDITNFTVLDGSFCVKDLINVFCYGSKMDGVDAPTFQFLSDPYFQDKNGIYVSHGDIMKKMDVDEKSFQVLDYGYAKDKNAVYLFGDKISNVDPESFQILNIFYWKDKNQVSGHGSQIPIEGADPATFEVFPALEENMDSEYAKDKNAIYSSGAKLEGADRETFTVSPLGVWDKYGPFFFGKRLGEK